MGYQDALYALRIPFASDEAVRFADESMELISFLAIAASVDLAAERGRYATFEGSLWSQGILPIDSVGLLQKNRKSELKLDLSAKLDWTALRERVKTVGHEELEHNGDCTDGNDLEYLRCHSVNRADL